MYYRDHGPVHFHAEYQGQQATFLFNGTILMGELRSGQARRLIREWAIARDNELQANWARVQAGESLERIPPLE